MKSWKRRLLLFTAEIALLLILHAVLLRVMADGQIVSRIFAAGRHVPATTLAAAGLFVVVRVFAVFFLPGMILARVGLLLYDWRQARGRPAEGSAP